LEKKLIQIIPADPGWRALFGADGEEFGRSRVVAWGLLATEGRDEVVGLIVHPSTPTQIVAASDVVDDEGGRLLRYAFVEA
jgi:hypothetical protein